MTSLSKVQLVNEAQLAFGELLGFDLRGCSVGVARAKIEDVISTRFWGHSDLGHPSPKQCALALKFGFDISNESRGVGFAVINDIMFQLNMEAIERLGLSLGVRVRHKSGRLEQVLVVSSVASDGTVYFKGGNGKKAWARSLERVE